MGDRGVMLTTADVAEHLNLSTDWVRSHAAELGAIRTSDGPGGELRFDPDEIDEWKRRRRLAQAPRKSRRKRAAPPGVELFQPSGSH